MGKPIPMTIGRGLVGNANRPSGNTSANTVNATGSGIVGANKSAGNSAQRKAVPLAVTRPTGGKSPLIGNLDK